MDIYNHIAYSFAALAFLVRDMIYLRIASIASSFWLIVADPAAGESLNANILWNMSFIGIHVTQLSITYFGEKKAKFSDEESELYETLFRSFTKLEFLKLLRAGRWLAAEPGQRLTEQGRAVPEVMLISNGVAGVEVGGKRVAELRDGQLVGEMSFVTGDPATATVTVTEPTRYLSWSKSGLRDLLHRNPTMRLAMGHIMSTEITRKLVRSTHGQ